MPKKECPSCAMMIDQRAEICPICQYEFVKNSPILKIVAVALAVLFLLYIFYAALR